MNCVLLKEEYVVCTVLNSVGHYPNTALKTQKKKKIEQGRGLSSLDFREINASNNKVCVVVSACFGQKQGYTTIMTQPCFFNIILPKELRPLPCSGFLFCVIKKSCVWVVTHRIVQYIFWLLGYPTGYKLAAPRIGFFFGPHLSRDY